MLWGGGDEENLAKGHDQTPVCMMVLSIASCFRVDRLMHVTDWQLCSDVVSVLS